MTLPTPEFLTFDEVAQVDRALLTAQDKFLARIALYSLRSLKHIAAETGQSLESVTTAQVADWINADPNLQTAQTGEQDVQSFKGFFLRLVISSLQPLRQIAETEEVAIAQLTIEQVIRWFETQAKLKLQ
jgi:hypothetical protein